MLRPEDDLLAPLLARAQVEGPTLGFDEAARLWSLVAPADDPRFFQFEMAIAPVPDSRLDMRAGPWRLDLAETAVRTSVLTALVAAVLIPQGLTEFAIGFVTAVLPSVLEIERVEFSAGDERLLVELRARAVEGSEDELYESLPAQTRAVVNPYDFANFLARLRQAGFAGGEGERIVLRAPDPR